MVRLRAPSALRVPISRVRSFTLTKVIFMIPIAPTKSERPVIKSPAIAMEFLIGSSVLFSACCSLMLKSSFFSGARPRTRRMIPVSSSLASASFVLSFTFTRMSESLLALKYFSAKSDSDILVKVKDKTKLAEARDELTGIMRRVRGLAPEKKDDFSINEQQALKSTLDPIKNSIAIAGLFITGLSLFVGAIGIMNITFVSVKERTREIGTRKALGARRRTILLQFLIESTSLCLLGGLIGLGVAYLMCTGVGHAFPSFPIRFSLGLVMVSMVVSILTGLFSGFAPAWSASRLDPVAALRYE